MLSELKSFSCMEVSNSEMFFAEKSLNSMEFNFLVRPGLEFEDECDIIAPIQDVVDDYDDDELQQKQEVQEQDHEEEEEEEEEDDKCNFLVSSLKVKLPPLGEFQIEEEDNDGFKTPTSLDQKIPAVILQCPPAPRKPTSLPRSTKRKSSPCQGVLLDLSNEIESLFPPAVAADLGGKVKRVRQDNSTKLREGANYV